MVDGFTVSLEKVLLFVAVASIWIALLFETLLLTPITRLVTGNISSYFLRYHEIQAAQLSSVRFS